MKKVIVIILLILPFALIYFISFTGRVLSIYNHINVEKIYVADNNNTYNNGDWINLSKGETKNIDVILLPELATNKEYNISNSDRSVCELEGSNLIALDYGVSTIIITSKDRHFVQFVINVRVVELDIQNIVINKEYVDIAVGKSELVDVAIEPSTTLEENRYLTWESMDINIASVKSGVITGNSVGETKVIVKSSHKPSVFREINVNVVNGLGAGVFFDYIDTSRVYDITLPDFDLKEITIINLDNVEYSDLSYSLEVLSNAVDVSKLNNGIIKFNEEKVPVVISVSVEIDGVLYSDSITIRYISD